MTKQKKRSAARAATRAGRQSVYRRPIPWPLIGIALALVVIGVLVVRTLELGAPGERISTSGVGQHITEGQTIPYPQTPPVGGPHWPAAAPWGMATAPVPDERAVHNLEHGGVVVSYNGIAAEDLKQLQALTLTYPRDKRGGVKLLIRQYDKTESGAFWLTAWGWRERFTAYDAGRVTAFLDAHLNKCCEDVP